MDYSNRRKPTGDRSRWVRVLAVVVVLAVVAVASVFAVATWLGPFPAGISGRDTALLTLWDQGQYQDVLLQAEAILEERPLDGQALTFGGFAQFYVGIDQATPGDQQAYLERSIVLLRKAEHVERAPLEAERRYVLAKAYYHRGQEYAGLAARYMEESVSAGYVGEDSFAYLGLAHEELGDHETSAGWYERGLQASGDSDDQALRIRAAEARRKLGDLEEAESHLRAALLLGDDDYVDGVVGINLSAVLIEQGEYTEAEQRLSQLVEASPDSADALYYLGVVYEMTDRMLEARGMWRRARELDPTHVKALESLANSEG